MNCPTRRRTQRLLAGALALTLVAAACGSDGDTATEPADDSTDEPAESGAATETIGGTLVGAGSSAQAAGMQGWQAGFQALNPDATVEYDAIGSGGGRELFLAGGSSFAGSDAFLKDDEFEEESYDD